MDPRILELEKTLPISQSHPVFSDENNEAWEGKWLVQDHTVGPSHLPPRHITSPLPRFSGFIWSHSLNNKDIPGTEQYNKHRLLLQF